MLEETAAQFEAILTRIESGTATGADLQRLREALTSRWSSTGLCPSILTALRGIKVRDIDKALVMLSKADRR